MTTPDATATLSMLRDLVKPVELAAIDDNPCAIARRQSSIAGALYLFISTTDYSN
jgi:hypothetical protein